LALKFKELATLKTDIPVFGNVDELRWAGPTARFAAWANAAGAGKLLERCQKLAAAGAAA